MAACSTGSTVSRRRFRCSPAGCSYSASGADQGTGFGRRGLYSATPRAVPVASYGAMSSRAHAARARIPTLEGCLHRVAPLLREESMLSVVWFIVAISVLVAAHEFGHFWVARRLKFKVLRFSIGFGRPLAVWRSRHPDRTEYWLSMIPLGGYVKMLDERETPVPAADQCRAVNQRPIPHRIAVLLAGPAFNFLFAIVAYWLMFATGVPGLKSVIGAVQPDSVAARAGIV